MKLWKFAAATLLTLSLGAAVSVSATAANEAEYSTPQDWQEPVIIDVTEDEMKQIRDYVEKNTPSPDYFVSTTASSQWDFSSHYYYDQLSSEMKKVYDKLKTDCTNYLNNPYNIKADSPYLTFQQFPGNGVTAAECKAFMNAFYFENPQFFFIRNGYYRYTNSSGLTSSVSVCLNTDYITASAVNEMSQKLQTITRDWMDDLEKINTDFGKEIYIAERLCDEITYKFSNNNQSIIGALIDHECVCNGYTMAFNYISAACGIDTIGVVGNNHAWNQIYLDGNWYSIDVTWMDQGTAKDIWFKWFNNTQEYFLKNDNQGSHKINETLYTGLFELPENKADYSDSYKYISIADTFPDNAVADVISASYDLNNDGKLSSYELERIYSLDIKEETTYLDGINDIPNLSALSIVPSDSVMSISLSDSIYSFSAPNGQISSIDLSNATSLEELDVSNNCIRSIDLGACEELSKLNVSGNQLAFIDLSGLDKLSSASLSGQKITAETSPLNGYGFEDIGMVKSNAAATSNGYNYKSGKYTMDVTVTAEKGVSYFSSVTRDGVTSVAWTPVSGAKSYSVYAIDSDSVYDSIWAKDSCSFINDGSLSVVDLSYFDGEKWVFCTGNTDWFLMDASGEGDGMWISWNYEPADKIEVSCQSADGTRNVGSTTGLYIHDTSAVNSGEYVYYLDVKSGSDTVASCSYSAKKPDKIELNAKLSGNQAELSWVNNASNTTRILRNTGSGWETVVTTNFANYTDDIPDGCGEVQYRAVPFMPFGQNFNLLFSSEIKSIKIKEEPLVLTAVSGDSSVSLSWDSLGSATKYRVRRKSGGAWTTLATVSGTSYTDAAPADGENTYVVIPYIGTEFNTALQSEPVTVKVARAAAPVITSSVNGRTVELTWTETAGASKYRLRVNDGTGWQTVATTAELAFSYTSDADGLTLEFVVIPYINGAFNTALQSKSAKATIEAESTTAVLTVTAQENNVTVSWNKVSGASKYRIRRNDGTGWTTLQTSDKTSYVDTTAQNGGRYTYVVYPFVNGSFAEPSKTVKVALVGGSGSAALTVFTDDGVAELSWAAVPGVKKYRVRRNDGTGWKTMASTSNLSWTDNSLVSGTTYTYVVYISTDGVNYSDPSSTITSKP